MLLLCDPAASALPSQHAPPPPPTPPTHPPTHPHSLVRDPSPSAPCTHIRLHPPPHPPAQVVETFETAKLQAAAPPEEAEPADTYQPLKTHAQ